MPRDFRPGGDLSGGVYADVNPYPAARTNRGRGIPTNNLTPAVPELPIVSLWSFHISGSTVNTMTAIGSRRFRGPVFLDRFTWAKVGPGNTASQSQMILRYSASEYAGQRNVTFPGAMTGINIWEGRLAPASTVATGTAADGTTQPFVNAQQFDQGEVEIRKFLSMEDVFLIFAFFVGVATLTEIQGWVRVLEKVPLEMLPDLIAS